MIEWQVPTEEDGPLPMAAEPAPAPKRHWGRTLLVALLLIAVVAGGSLWWRHRQNEEQLRTIFTEVVHNEVRVLASRDVTAMQALVYPNQTARWTSAFQALGLYRGLTVLLPSVRDVTLSDEGREALVTVAYPRPAGPLYEGLDPIEQRQRYRLHEGNWLRYPLPMDESATTEQRSAHFVLRGPTASVEALNRDGQLLAEVEALYDYLVETWPATMIGATPVPIELRPQEFDSLSFSGGGLGLGENPTSPIVINSSDCFMPLPAIALSSEDQYRLFLAKRVVMRLTGDVTAYGTPERPIAWYYLDLSLQIRGLQAESLVLDEAALRRLRNEQRHLLAGERISLFSPEIARAASAYDFPPGYYESMALLVEYVRVTYGDAALGHLAERLADAPADLPLGDLFTEAIGATVEELERGVRDFTATTEAP